MLPDVMQFRQRALPFRAVFWRPQMDRKHCQLDPVTHRNPIFDAICGTSPARTMVVDALHTVNFGPAMRWTAAMMGRILLHNPWHFEGTQNEVLELGCRAMKAHMLAWFAESQALAAESVTSLSKCWGRGRAAKLEERAPIQVAF